MGSGLAGRGGARELAGGCGAGRASAPVEPAGGARELAGGCGAGGECACEPAGGARELAGGCGAAGEVRLRGGRRLAGAARQPTACHPARHPTEVLDLVIRG